MFRIKTGSRPARFAISPNSGRGNDALGRQAGAAALTAAART
ncbi:hypothetical protein ACFSL6_07140 [Paenibacillus thailandensis]|uniref:Uncharacterized protein n=1 Tax=Paenibacillus thailandensis TaxID=393250 RepID=A0ABW5R3C6_9BACL